MKIIFQRESSMMFDHLYYFLLISDPKMSNEFLLIGRNFRHWQACLHHEKSKPEDLNPNNLPPKPQHGSKTTGLIFDI